MVERERRMTFPSYYAHNKSQIVHPSILLQMLLLFIHGPVHNVILASEVCISYEKKESKKVALRIDFLMDFQ